MRCLKLWHRTEATHAAGANAGLRSIRAQLDSYEDHVNYDSPTYHMVRTYCSQEIAVGVLESTRYVWEGLRLVQWQFNL